MREVIKFEVNKPVIVRCVFDSPIEMDGKYGKQYFYTVKKDDDEKEYGFYATPRLNQELQKLGKLSSQKIEIVKKSDTDGMKFWSIKEIDVQENNNQEDELGW